MTTDLVESGDDELRRLRATLRDLVALSTVSAMWEGRDLEGIARSMVELLLNISRLEYAYLRVERQDAEPLEIAQERSGAGLAVPAVLLDEVRNRLRVPGDLEIFEAHGVHGSRALRVALVPIGIGARLGMAAVASTSPSFPSENDMLLLRVAATQCAISLRHNRLLTDARRAEEQSRRHSEAAERARFEAEEANRAKADFLAAMSHELRTPLNAIAGYASLIEMGLRGPVTPEQLLDLQRIRRSQEYLLRLINDVLNFVKLEAGHVSLDIADVDVTEVADTLEELIGPQLAAKQLAYTLLSTRRPLIARADREKVVQILLNLVSNAVKFTAPGGRLEITCSAERGLVRVAVSDTGIGIPDDKLSAIFDPFVQVPRELKSVREGVGLGLAISRDLARAMGGDLVASSTIGQGSTFSLTLPAS